MKTLITTLLALIFMAGMINYNQGQSIQEDYKALPVPYMNNINEQFGGAVSVDGNYAVVGAQLFNDQQGCAYVLHYSGTVWETLGRLVASDGQASDAFGSSVSISGNTVAIGAYLDDREELAAGSVYVFEIPEEEWTEISETAILVASDDNALDYFGSSVSISGDLIVAGAYKDDERGTDAGAAYLFEKPEGGWSNMVETAKLTASDGSESDWFGNSVCISGETVIIGAHMKDDHGRVYLYDKPESGWSNMTETAQLSASDAATGDQFGRAVSISNDVIVIGSNLDDDMGNSSGSVYLFSKPVEGWISMTESAKLSASVGGTNDYFGTSVCISEDAIIVGAPEDNGFDSGSAYVFQKPANGWENMTETAILTPSDGGERDYFGFAVAISDDKVVIGAKFHDGEDLVSGAAYLYNRLDYLWIDETENQKVLPIPYENNAREYFGNSVAIDGDYAVIGAPEYGLFQGCAYILHYTGSAWKTLARLQASDNEPMDFFGNSVDISGDVIVVGAHWDNDRGNNSGSAYVFEKPQGGWIEMTETAKLTASDGAERDYFGYAVSISGDVIVIGAYWDDDNGNYSGSAYVFEKPSGGWSDMNETGKLTPSDGDAYDWFGSSVDISGDQIVIAAINDDENGDASGSAYIFVKPVEGWTSMSHTAKLLATTEFFGSPYDNFGCSVGITDEVVVIGAKGEDGENNSKLDAGIAYVFIKPEAGWQDANESATLSASDSEKEDRFGHSVAIGDGRIVIGAFEDNEKGENSGSAYVFDQPMGGWESMTETYKLTASDGGEDDHFGFSLSVSGNLVAIGAKYDDDNGNNSGSAYLFNLPDLTVIHSMRPDEASFYPNPTDGMIIVDPSLGMIERVAVMDTHGRIIAQANNFFDHSLDLSEYAVGVYFVKVVTDRGIYILKVLRR